MKKIKTFIIDLTKKNKLFRRIVRASVYGLKRIKYFFYQIRYRINDKQVIFEVFGGRNYTCSPKAIYERMLTMDEFKDYKFIWAFKDPSKHEIKQDPRTIVVKSNSNNFGNSCGY